MSTATLQTAAAFDPHFAAMQQRVAKLNACGVLMASDFEEEIAYRLPGEGWKRRTFRNEKKMAKFIDQLIDDGAEIRHRS